MAQPRTTVLLSLVNEPDATRKLRAALTRVVESYELPSETAFELKVAATEALTNAFKSAAENHAIDVAITGSAIGIDVEITDGGRFAPEVPPESQLEAESGRGIPLMLALADEVEFASEGDRTRVRMRKRTSR